MELEQRLLETFQQKKREVAVIFLLVVDVASDPIDCCETCLFSIHLFLVNVWANVQLTTLYNC